MRAKQERIQRKAMLGGQRDAGHRPRAPFISPAPPGPAQHPPHPAQPERPESCPPVLQGPWAIREGTKPRSKPELALSLQHPSPWEKGSCPGPVSPRTCGNTWHPQGAVGQARKTKKRKDKTEKKKERNRTDVGETPGDVLATSRGQMTPHHGHKFLLAPGPWADLGNPQLQST